MENYNNKSQKKKKKKKPRCKHETYVMRLVLIKQKHHFPYILRSWSIYFLSSQLGLEI